MCVLRCLLREPESSVQNDSLDNTTTVDSPPFGPSEKAFLIATDTFELAAVPTLTTLSEVLSKDRNTCSQTSSLEDLGLAMYGYLCRSRRYAIRQSQLRMLHSRSWTSNWRVANRLNNRRAERIQCNDAATLSSDRALNDSRYIILVVQIG